MAEQVRYQLPHRINAPRLPLLDCGSRAMGRVVNIFDTLFTFEDSRSCRPRTSPFGIITAAEVEKGNETDMARPTVSTVQFTEVGQQSTLF